MILARGIFSAGTAMIVIMAAPASADVLEIGAEGPRWIAGGPIAHHEVRSAPPQEMMIADEAAAPQRFVEVASGEAQARGVPAPFAAKVAELAGRYDLSPALIEALVWQESRWRPAAISPKGARGLAQLMPSTARELGVDPDDPLANLEGGARYLREQLDRFDGDLEKALAAYNAGPGRVQRASGVPRIRETQNYVAAVMERLNTHGRKEDF